MADFPLPQRFVLGSKYLNYIIILLALSVLVGWEFDIELLKRPLHLKAMNPVSALCFLSFGVSFWILGFSAATRTKSTFAYLLILFIFFVGLAKILAISGGPDFEVDTILFADKIYRDIEDGGVPSQMTFNTALNFTILGIALFFTFTHKKTNKAISNFLVLILLFVALFSIIVYIYQVKEFLDTLSYFTMAIHTAFGFVLIAMTILFFNSEAGFSAVISNPNSGGTIARILLPAAIIAPIAIGLLRLLFFHWNHEISVELGVSILIISIILIFFSLVLFASNVIAKKDVLRLEAEEKLIAFTKNLEEEVKSRTEEIRKSENRFRALIENINEGIVMNDEHSALLYQSPSVERILGYTREERLEKPVKNFVHPDNQKDFEILYQSIGKNPGKSFPFQYQFRHKKGHYVWLEGTVTNGLHVPGVNAYIANYRDITERKEHEQKIAASEQRFRLLIENNADVISLTDKNLNVIYQSPQGEKITGYTQEERAALEAQDLLHPDDIAILTQEYPKLFTDPEKPISFHYRFKHKLGHYIWVEGSLKNLLDDPTISAIVVNFRDVSERKLQEDKLAASEMRFRTLIENNFDCILLTTEKSELLYQSPSVERITGFAPPEKIAVSEFFNVHPEDVRNAKILSTRLRENPGVPIRFQLRFPRKSGEYMCAEGVSTNFLQDSRVNAIVTNFRDVTDQKASEAEILKLNAELEERVQKRTTELEAANKELESFSYSVSHDLRAPLRIINGFSQLLMEDYYDKLDQNGQRIINRIMRNAHKMGQLIDDLLNFSKLGRAEMRKSMVNMALLVREVLSDLEASGISIPKQTHVGELTFCYCDSPLIKQVWLNLISNAIKYSSGKESPMIEIGMTPDNRPTYFVKDNGAGFDMTYVHKLFGVFQRLHKAEEFEGTGVGLAIVQRIILRHGGEVWAEAKENEGATFFFNIPVSDGTGDN